MSSHRKPTARMSTGGKPPKQSSAYEEDLQEDNGVVTPSVRPRRVAKPTAKKLANQNNQDLGDESNPDRLVGSDEDEVELIEDVPLPIPATPQRKTKSLPKKKGVEQRPQQSKKMVTNNNKRNISTEFVELDEDPAGITAPLDPDDGMYSGGSQSKIFPFEPETPHASQNNARRIRERELHSPNTSPTKKQRLVPSDGERTPSNDRGKKTLLLGSPITMDGEAASEDQTSTISSSDEITIESSHKTSLEALDGLSFKDVFATPKKECSSQDEATVFLEDLTPNGQKKPVINLPEVCEVTETGLQDPFLLEKGFYKGLVNLPGGRDKNPQYYMLPIYNYKAKGGRPNFEGWKAMCPEMNIGYAIRPLIFQQSGRFINLSRIDPRKIRVDAIIPNERSEITVDGDTAICLSCVMVKDSFLYGIDAAGQASLSNKYHLLRAKFMAYEFERASSVITLLFGKGQLYAMLKGDANEFQTKQSVDPSNSNASGQSAAAPPASQEELEEESVPGFMNTQSTSPSKQFVRPPPKFPLEKKGKKVRALAFDDTIPIYDGRATAFDYNDLEKLDGNLDQVFPRYPVGEEIPSCSYAVVAYVSQLSSFRERIRKEDGSKVPGEYRWKFTPFIQWVIVIGISKKHIRGYTE